MSSSNLFVYGTLRRNTKTPMHDLLMSSATDLGPAFWQGQLYMVSDWYPGAVPSDNPEDRVLGEVYQLHAPELTLPVLDRYEGCDDESRRDEQDLQQEYSREQTSITLMDGTSVTAWIYRYNMSVAHFERIPSGDFLQHHLPE